MHHVSGLSTCTLLHATHSDPAKLTTALSGLEQPRTAKLSKEASVMHPDSGIDCQPEWCPALALSLILDWFVIWPKHQFSHFQVMLFQDGRALQSIVWPVYMSAHKAGILGLRLRTAPVQVQEPNRVCAIRLCPAAWHMPCGQHMWTSAEV